VSSAPKGDSSPSAAPGGFTKLRSCATKQVLMGLFAFVLAALTLSFPFGLNLANGRGWRRDRYGYQHKARLGAVTSLSSNCSKIGALMITEGGNAIDAVLAAEFCLGVVGMYDTGLGGGGLALVRRSDGSHEAVDFREAAPAAASYDMYAENQNASLQGGLASGVPGALRGIQYLYDHYATMLWADLIAPAIHLARQGFIVNADLINIFEGLDDQSFLVSDPAWATDFAPNGTLVGLGDTLTRPRYADLLQAIADDGPDVFYTGASAEATISALQKAHGIMTMADLRDYKITLRETLQVKYRDYLVTSVGSPSSGAVVLKILKTIAGYQTLGDSAMTNISTHRVDEAIRFGYGARTALGDPSFFPNITAYEHTMLTEQVAFEIRSKILDDQTQPVSAYDPSGIESLDTPGTSHVSAADHSGLAVSLTSTINLWFGSRLIVPETGLIMNNEMNDFSIPGSSDAFGYISSPSNYVAPGKRPMSSMSPIIVDFSANDTLFATLGASGGSYIITSVLQTLLNILDRHMPLPAALAAPRMHDQLVPNLLELEYAYDNATAAFMIERGHNVTWAARESVVQGLMRHGNGTFVAAADPVQSNGGGVTV